MDELAPAYSKILKTVRELDSPELRAIEFAQTRSTHVLACGDESFVAFGRDQAIARQLYILGHFEFEKLALAAGICSGKFDTIIDVGANIGVTCIPAVRRGLTRRAFAVEPDPSNFNLLMANLYLNAVHDRISAFNLAAGCQPGQTVQLELSEDNMGDHRIRVSAAPGQYDESGRRTIPVRSEPLDSIFSFLVRDELTRTLLWIDTQGYEGLVLKGASRFMEARSPLVIEFWPYGLARTGCFPELVRIVTDTYRSFFILNGVAPQANPVTAAALVDLFNMVGIDGSHVDLLFM